jgi:histidinol-phosphate aminotransferase
LADWHGCAPGNVIVGNGSDDLLAMAVRAFVEPADSSRGRAASTVQYLTPSYSLYPVLGGMHGARLNPVPLSASFGLPRGTGGRAGGVWERNAALSLITTPNAPSGRGYGTRELARLCRAQRGVVVLDEAYADFARENAMELALAMPHVLVARTFSKGYSLCFLRVGYMVGHEDLIGALHKVRDSYNVNGLAQIAALAAVRDRRYFQANIRRIVAERRRLASALQRMGFQVHPSQANFLFVKPPARPAAWWLDALRGRKILVRWFSAPETRDRLRVTIGAPGENRILLRAVRELLSNAP